jgi:exodeoxyribonuclease VII large subunit
MFRRAASLVDFHPEDGQSVEIRGRIAVYEPRGELQFVVEAMRRCGDGALMEQFLRIKAKLQAQGLFDADRKRPLPSFAKRVGVVTSLDGAALHDVASAFARRAPHVEVIVYPSLVQGAQAPATLASALQLASQRAEVDLLIVCRGGGSLEDLWAFNDEAVVRAVVACPMPVISGVGHETDICLVDFAADLRAPTPTAAAELAAPETVDAAMLLVTRWRQLQGAVNQQLDRQAQRLDRLVSHMTRPVDSVHKARTRLNLLGQRLASAQQRSRERTQLQLSQLAGRLLRAKQAHGDQHRHRLDALATRLIAADPEQVLKRGYTWLTDTNGAPVISAGLVEVGQSLCAVWADGRAEVKVVGLSRRTDQNA